MLHGESPATVAMAGRYIPSYPPAIINLLRVIPPESVSVRRDTISAIRTLLGQENGIKNEFARYVRSFSLPCSPTDCVD